MTETFTASNGKVFGRAYDGCVRYDGEGDMQGRRMVLTSTTEQGLTEFFQHERDEELGRWRDPQRPEWIANPTEDPNTATFFNERTAERVEVTRNGGLSFVPYMKSEDTEVARRYFDAHPEPKPWHDAKPGEVWELTTTGVDDRRIPTVFRVSGKPGRLEFHAIEPDYSVTHLGSNATAIVAGRRIWPEEE